MSWMNSSWSSIGSFNRSLRWFTKCSSISSCFFSFSPASFWRYDILFLLLWLRRELWKNFVFLSPSLNHFSLDFCFHIVSSLFSCWSIVAFSCPYFSLLSSYIPLWIISYCRSSISFSSCDYASKIFQKTSLFHVFNICLVFFCFCWNLYMCVSLLSSL